MGERRSVNARGVKNAEVDAQYSDWIRHETKLTDYISTTSSKTQNYTITTPNSLLYYFSSIDIFCDSHTQSVCVNEVSLYKWEIISRDVKNCTSTLKIWVVEKQHINSHDKSNPQHSVVYMYMYIYIHHVYIYMRLTPTPLDRSPWQLARLRVCLFFNRGLCVVA